MYVIHKGKDSRILRPTNKRCKQTIDNLFFAGYYTLHYRTAHIPTLKMYLFNFFGFLIKLHCMTTKPIILSLK